MRPEGGSRGGGTTSSNVWGIGVEVVLHEMCLRLSGPFFCLNFEL